MAEVHIIDCENFISHPSEHFVQNFAIVVPINIVISKFELPEGQIRVLEIFTANISR